MGWRAILLTNACRRKREHDLDSEWHAGDEGWRAEKTGIMAEHVDSTAHFLNTSPNSPIIWH